VLGHKTPRMAIEYVKRANADRLSDAAMDKWEAAG
jgi:hypothetical protein